MFWTGLFNQTEFVMRSTIQSWLLSVLAAGLLLSCTDGNYKTDEKGRALKDFSQYNNMVEVMQNVRGLRVMGNGSNAYVFMSGYNTTSATNKPPLFVVDGVAIGNSLSQLDNLLTPVQVKSVRTLRGMQATSRYGDQASFGVVLIKTVNSEPN